MHRVTAQAIALTLVLAACSRPAAPSGPSGPAWPLVGEACWFETAGTGGDACYRFDWGDGDISEWSDPLSAGTGFIASHRWRAPGRFAVRAQARSARGPTSPWSVACTASVLPLPGYPDTVVRRITLPGEATAQTLAFTPDGRSLCVGTDAERILVIDAATGALQSASTDVDAYRILFTPSGETAYVNDGASAVVFDAQSWQQIGYRGLGFENYDIALTSDGQYLVGCGYDWEEYVKVIRLSDDSLVAEFNDINASGLLAAVPGSPLVYLTSGMESDAAYAIRTSDMSIRGPMAMGASPLAVAASSDGRWVYVVDLDNDWLWRIRTADSRVEGVASVSYWIGEPPNVAAHPSGRCVYVGSDGVAIVDPERRRVIGYLPDPVCYDTPHQLAVSPDGGAVAAAGEDGVLLLGFTGHLPGEMPAPAMRPDRVRPGTRPRLHPRR